MAEVDPFRMIFSTVDNALDSYVVDTVSRVIEFLVPIFTSMMILFVAMWGGMMMFGQIQEPLKDGIFRIIRMSLIVMFALTLDNYTGVIVQMLQVGPENVASIVAGTDTAGSTAETLDALFTKVLKIAEVAWKKGGLLNGNIGFYLIAAAVLVVGGVLTLLVAFLILLAKIMISILLSIGPLFIVMLMFQSTQRFFESWLGMTINFGLLMVIATAIGKLMIELSDQFIGRMAPTEASYIELARMVDAAVLCVMFGLCILVMKQVTSISSSLGGGLALHTQGAISNAINRLRPSSAAQGMRNLGRDLQTTRRAAAAPINAGKSVAQSVRRRFGGNTITPN